MPNRMLAEGQGMSAEPARLPANWDILVTSLNELTRRRIGACERCGGLARYEGRACADERWVKLCQLCLDEAIGTLELLRDEAKLSTGYEPLCNRCWRPILDPSTHLDLRLPKTGAPAAARSGRRATRRRPA